MNMKVRTASDVKTLSSKGTTSGEKKRALLSLSSTGLEVLIYRAIATSINELIKGVVYGMMDYDPEEDDPRINKAVIKENKRRGKNNHMSRSEEEDFRKEEHAKSNYFWKTASTNMVTDLLSPLQMADPIVLWAGNKVASGIQGLSKSEENSLIRDENERRAEEGKAPLKDKEIEKLLEENVRNTQFRFWDGSGGDSEWAKYGVYGIAGEKMTGTADMFDAWIDGEIETGGKYSSKRTLLPEDRETAKNIFLWKTLYNLRLLPSEVGYATDVATKVLANRALTDSQSDRLKELKKLVRKPTDEQMNLIMNGTGSAESIVRETYSRNRAADIISANK